MKKFISWLSNRSLFEKIGLAALVGLFVLPVFGGVSTAMVYSATHVNKTTTQKSQATENIVKKSVTETENIPFATKTVDDANLPKGQTTVDPDGVNGIKTITYNVTYKNGEQVEKTKTGESVTKQPIDKVIHNGISTPPVTSSSSTCGTGYYINSAGNCVQSPSYASSVPAGASAQCTDGTYSFSQTRRGTCSHHGGVAVWY